MAQAPMAHAAPSALTADAQSQYDSGVTAYRNGQYDKALPLFRSLTKQQPGCIECHYYQAISATQLKHYQEARLSYDTVIELAPNSDAAELAHRGLQYLPQPNALDEPPEVLDAKGSPIRRAFQRAKSFVKAQTSDAAEAPTASSNGYIHPALARQPKVSPGWQAVEESELPGASAISTRAARQSMGDYDDNSPPAAAQPAPQTANNATNNDQMMKMMQMMMMMNSMGGNNNGGGMGFNPMMMNMMESMDGNNPGQSKIAPDVMSQLMMNQMTSQMDLFKNNNNDNN